MSDLLDVSIRIGNSYNSEKITPGKTYDFRVNKNTRIKNLKDIFYECIISENGNTDEIKKEINNVINVRTEFFIFNNLFKNNSFKSFYKNYFPF